MQQNVLIHDADQRQWLSFTRPKQIYAVSQPGDILPTLDRIEQNVSRDKLWAVGWVSYEAAGAFDPALVTHKSTEFPLLWFGLFADCQRVSLESMVSGDQADAFQKMAWSMSCDPRQYAGKIARIKNEIRHGNTYQVNYTIRQYADMEVPPEDVFLGFAANARYGAFIDAGRFAVCCASPELFFQVDDGRISSRPMKGTAPRGRYPEQDYQLRDELLTSEKNRAENLMIVDMVRNDIGRIARTGSVGVPKLFEIEKYPTVWQMTSTVTAQTDVSLGSIFQALFPCASITGSPKANTMKIINQLEPRARDIYTGTIGFIRPDRSMQFNVAIRTVLIDKKTNRAEYGVGGGIVWDSDAESEYRECLTKSRVLSGQGIYTHRLLETLLWKPESGFFLLDYHLHRLKQSAAYFDYSLDTDWLKASLQNSVSSAKVAQKIRLLLDKNGAMEVQTVDFQPPASPPPYRVKLSDIPVDRNDVFLYHKTTRRSTYQYLSGLYPEFDDVLLVNKQGQPTESCIANLVVETGGKKYTPPVDCGLLNGTYRQYLLDQGEIVERILTKADLHGADGIYLINSVRKMWPILVQ